MRLPCPSQKFAKIKKRDSDIFSVGGNRVPSTPRGTKFGASATPKSTNKRERVTASQDDDDDEENGTPTKKKFKKTKAAIKNMEEDQSLVKLEDDRYEE
jgi:hypothetical protein